MNECVDSLEIELSMSKMRQEPKNPICPAQQAPPGDTGQRREWGSTLKVAKLRTLSHLMPKIGEWRDWVRDPPSGHISQLKCSRLLAKPEVCFKVRGCPQGGRVRGRQNWYCNTATAML